MTENKWTSEKLLEMKLCEISDLLQACYHDNKDDGLEEVKAEIYATFPDTGQRMVLTVSLSEVNEE